MVKQKRMERIPVSGPILCEKAVQLHKKLYGDQSDMKVVADLNCRV